MFSTENEDVMPVEVVDTMVASIVLSQGGRVVVSKAARDRVNTEGLVYAFEVDANGDGVLTTISKAERDEQEKALLDDADAFIRELFKSLGMTDEEIDAAIAQSKNI